jgi:hypothetical protein
LEETTSLVYEYKARMESLEKNNKFLEVTLEEIENKNKLMVG